VEVGPAVKTLDRYVTWNFAVSVFVAFVFLLCIYVMVHFFSRIEDLALAQRGFEARGLGLFRGLCRYYALTMPFMIAKLGPFAVLLAAMWTLQKMARDQEVAAAQVAGVSLHRLTAPILAFGLLVSLGLWAVRQEVLPRIAIESHELERLLRGKKEAVIDGPMVLRDSSENRFSIQTYEPSTRIARGVQFRSADLARSSDFEAMQYDPERSLWLVRGAAGGLEPLPIETDLNPRDIEIDARGLRFLASDELDQMARKLPGRLDLALLRQTRFTYPFTTIVLLLLGIPLVLKRERQSIYAAWGLCLLVSILYFGVENVLHGLAERDAALSPALAAWMPVVVFGIGGALTFQDL
jgi:lipopolysaccharide export LptBFGC system permease protein LptF